MFVRRSLALFHAVLIVGACAGVDGTAGRVVAVDDLGDTLRLAAPASRIVSLNPVTTELLFAMGAGDRVVGRTRWDLSPAAARDVPDVGDGMQPNVEAILGREPDLVVLYASAANHAAVRQLRAAGVGTLAIRTDHTTDLPRVAALLATALDDAASAGRAVDTVLVALDRVRQAPRAAAPPRVLWFIWEAPLLTIGGGSFMSELLVIAGAVNVFGDLEAPSPQVSLEEIARRDPDAIICGPVNAARIRANPAWQAVRAVREGRILIADTALVGRPGVRMGEAARHLRALILGDTVR